MGPSFPEEYGRTSGHLGPQLVSLGLQEKQFGKDTLFIFVPHVLSGPFPSQPGRFQDPQILTSDVLQCTCSLLLQDLVWGSGGARKTGQRFKIISAHDANVPKCNT
jgi:hypothetical protein